jgi:hypothetical protein
LSKGDNRKICNQNCDKIFTYLSILVSGLHMLYHNFYCIPSHLFPSDFPTNILYAFPFSPLRSTCHAHLILLHLVILIILGEGYKLFHLFSLGLLSKESVQVRGPLRHFVTRLFFYGELLAPRPTSKLEDYPLLTVRDCLFNIFAATPISGGHLFLPQPEATPCCGDKGPI